jgi:hypothetical protein
VAYRLKIVSSALFITNMSVNRSVTSCSGEILAFSEWDMLTVGVLIALSQTEIDDEDVVLVGFIASYQEVVWLDVSMDNPFFVHLLDSLYLLAITGHLH